MNMDATQVSCGMSGKEVRSFYIQSVDDEGEAINADAPLKRDAEANDDNPVYVFLFITASGVVGPPVEMTNSGRF